MVVTISESQYEERVDELADTIVRELEEHGDGDVLGAVSESLDAEEWFFRDRFGAAAHGCIIEHSDANPENYRDVGTAFDTDSIAEAVKRAAFFCMEADVTEAVRDRTEA